MQSGRSAAPVVAIAGATGAVGIELLGCLERRNFPLSKLRLFASARSVGKTLPFRGKPVPVEELTEQALEGVDIGLFFCRQLDLQAFRAHRREQRCRRGR